MVSDDVRVVCDAGRAGVAGPAVGPGRGAGGEVGAQEGVQAVGGEVLDPRQADPAGPTLADLDSAGDQQLALVAAPTAAARRFILGAGRRSGFRPLRPGPPAACALVRPWPGAAWWRATMRSCRNPGRAASGVAAPRSRWSAWPSDRRPRTTRISASLGAVHHRTGRHRGLLATVGAFMGVCLGRERPPPAAAAGRTDEACRPAQDWPGRRRRLLRLENAVGTPTGNGGSRSFLGIPRVMMFTLCSITTLAPRHHISWSRTLRDQPLSAKAYPSGSGRINGWWPSMLRAQRRDPAKAQAKCAFATNYPLANRQLRSPLILRHRMQRDKP